MKSIPKVLFLSIALYNISCSEDKKNERNSPDSIELTKELPKVDTTPTTNVDTVTTSQTAVAPSPTIQARPAANEVTKNAVLLNPPHGQPGHDCAVAEGAPLNSKPKSTLPSTTPQITSPNVTLPPSNPLLNPTTNSTGQKLNPAHGLPGHDCAIPVGAPLK